MNEIFVYIHTKSSTGRSVINIDHNMKGGKITEDNFMYNFVNENQLVSIIVL